MLRKDGSHALKATMIYTQNVKVKANIFGF